MTGDLTEDGVDSQFEVLAEVLRNSGVPPAHVTLVPGNHDAPLRVYHASHGRLWPDMLANAAEMSFSPLLA